ncbi:MAG: HXXEE domain-containing protein [Thermoflexales bacterium]|nr:HXXEE domain-containing protein [Thermoflexales bacterium]
MSKFRELKLEHLILGTLLLYVTLHLLEEGLFGFPAWAEARWGIPGYTAPKWLLHNVYFSFFLALGYVVYRRDKDRFLFVGLGIIIWGLLNMLNHTIFSLLFLEYSPGLFTGFVFGLFAVLAFRRVREMGRLSWRLALSSFLFGLLYWTVPIVLFISVDQALGI